MSEGFLLCENCRRERLRRDVFWHHEDEAWYCQDVFACECRYYIQGEREVVLLTANRSAEE